MTNHDDRQDFEPGPFVDEADLKWAGVTLIGITVTGFLIICLGLWLVLPAGTGWIGMAGSLIGIAVVGAVLWMALWPRSGGGRD